MGFSIFYGSVWALIFGNMGELDLESSEWYKMPSLSAQLSQVSLWGVFFFFLALSLSLSSLSLSLWTFGSFSSFLSSSSLSVWTISEFCQNFKSIKWLVLLK